jgi:hypothetical protein
MCSCVKVQHAIVPSMQGDLSLSLTASGLKNLLGLSCWGREGPGWRRSRSRLLGVL